MAGNPEISWVRDDVLARVQLSHPGRMNAITVGMWQQLAECFRWIAGQSGLRAVEIRGADGAFAAGADISEFGRLRATPEQARRYHEDIIAPALTAIAHCPIPVLAAIDGVCVGGGLEIASVCDLRIASDRSRFGIPIHALGFPLAPREADALVALVGPSVALEMLLEGRVFGADEALCKGLIHRVVAATEWERDICMTLERLCGMAPHAARRSKWLIRTLAAGRRPDDMSPAEFDACWDFADTQDYRRGIAAFLDRKRPDFQDD